MSAGGKWWRVFNDDNPLESALAPSSIPTSKVMEEILRMSSLDYSPHDPDKARRSWGPEDYCVVHGNFCTCEVCLGARLGYPDSIRAQNIQKTGQVHLTATVRSCIR